MKNLLGLICIVSLLTACENSGTPPPGNPQIQEQSLILSRLYKSWSLQMNKVQWQDAHQETLPIAQAYVLGSVIFQLDNQPKAESIQLLLDVFPKLSDPRSDSSEMLKLAKEFLKKENI
ncbi:hypothetical protein ACLSU7_06555 [Bdellovibrio sp. HCB185ZH]|uniref:hypothetical protein n=1 Tax=Bdellovibrio sp. HCB185ZH TaxID=3394235 RepID=UPI0039A57C7E